MMPSQPQNTNNPAPKHLEELLTPEHLEVVKSVYDYMDTAQREIVVDILRAKQDGKPTTELLERLYQDYNEMEQLESHGKHVRHALWAIGI